MTYTRRIITASALVAVFASATTACGGDSSPTTPSVSADASASGSVASTAATATSEATAVDPAVPLSSKEFCDLLTPEDLRSLSAPPVDVEPSPKTQDGLPGCDWSLGEGDSHLELQVTKPVDADALRRIAKETFPVGPSAKGYVTVPGLLGSCQASVSSDQTPAGYLLQYHLRTYDDRFSGCQPAITQVVTVLKGLKW